MSTDWLIEEYKLVWGFYIRTIESREKVIDFYFKSIAIPAGLLVTFATMLRFGIFGDVVDGDSALNSTTFSFGLSLLLLVIFLTGFGTFLYYSKETQVSIEFRNYLSSIIERAKEKDADLKAIDMNPLRERLERSRLSLGRATFLRISPIVVINSAVGGLALFAKIVETSQYNAIVVAMVSFILLILFHGLIFYIHNPGNVKSVVPAANRE
ncbi:hypothetical protein KHP62_06835 [Rhodobacteraceae bacterium NNCM2]|nr:hypothetical protein [Coraliihabitans acroporae]